MTFNSSHGQDGPLFLIHCSYHRRFKRRAQLTGHNESLGSARFGSRYGFHSNYDLPLHRTRNSINSRDWWDLVVFSRRCGVSAMDAPHQPDPLVFSFFLLSLFFWELFFWEPRPRGCHTERRKQNEEGQGCRRFLSRRQDVTTARQSAHTKYSPNSRLGKSETESRFTPVWINLFLFVCLFVCFQTGCRIPIRLSPERRRG